MMMRNSQNENCKNLTSLDKDCHFFGKLTLLSPLLNLLMLSITTPERQL